MRKIIKSGFKEQFGLIERGGLNITILRGMIDFANESERINRKDLVLEDNATNYIFVDWNTREIASNQTGFPGRSKPLYEIQTENGSVKSVIDKRAVARISAHSVFETHNEYLLEVSSDVDVDWAEVDLSGLAPYGATGVFIHIEVKDSGTPGEDVYVAFRKSGDSELSRWVRISPQASGVWNLVAVPVGLLDYKFEYMMSVGSQMDLRVSLLGWMFGK